MEGYNNIVMCEQVALEVYKGFADILSGRASKGPGGTSKLKGAATMLLDTYLLRFTDEAEWKKVRNLNEYQVEILDSEIDRHQDNIDNLEYKTLQSGSTQWANEFLTLFRAYYVGWFDIYHRLQFWTSPEGKQAWLRTCENRNLQTCLKPCQPLKSFLGRPKCSFTTKEISPGTTTSKTIERTRSTPK